MSEYWYILCHLSVQKKATLGQFQEFGRLVRMFYTQSKSSGILTCKGSSRNVNSKSEKCLLHAHHYSCLLWEICRSVIDCFPARCVPDCATHGQISASLFRLCPPPHFDTNLMEAFLWSGKCQTPGRRGQISTDTFVSFDCAPCSAAAAMAQARCPLAQVKIPVHVQYLHAIDPVWDCTVTM